jgi:hypothetical protein
VSGERDERVRRDVRGPVHQSEELRSTRLKHRNSDTPVFS